MESDGEDDGGLGDGEGDMGSDWESAGDIGDNIHNKPFQKELVCY